MSCVRCLVVVTRPHQDHWRLCDYHVSRNLRQSRTGFNGVGCGKILGVGN